MMRGGALPGLATGLLYLALASPPMLVKPPKGGDALAYFEWIMALLDGAAPVIVLVRGARMIRRRIHDPWVLWTVLLWLAAGTAVAPLHTLAEGTGATLLGLTLLALAGLGDLGLAGGGVGTALGAALLAVGTPAGAVAGLPLLLLALLGQPWRGRRWLGLGAALLPCAFGVLWVWRGRHGDLIGPWPELVPRGWAPAHPLEAMRALARDATLLLAAFGLGRIGRIGIGEGYRVAVGAALLLGLAAAAYLGETGGALLVPSMLAPVLALCLGSFFDYASIQRSAWLGPPFFSVMAGMHVDGLCTFSARVATPWWLVGEIPAWAALVAPAAICASLLAIMVLALQRIAGAGLRLSHAATSLLLFGGALAAARWAAGAL